LDENVLASAAKGRICGLSERMTSRPAFQRYTCCRCEWQRTRPSFVRRLSGPRIPRWQEPSHTIASNTSSSRGGLSPVPRGARRPALGTRRWLAGNTDELRKRLHVHVGRRGIRPPRPSAGSLAARRPKQARATPATNSSPRGRRVCGHHGLGKRFGWGVHARAEGPSAIYAVRQQALLRRLRGDPDIRGAANADEAPWVFLDFRRALFRKGLDSFLASRHRASSRGGGGRQPSSSICPGECVAGRFHAAQSPPSACRQGPRIAIRVRRGSHKISVLV